MLVMIAVLMAELLMWSEGVGESTLIVAIAQNQNSRRWRQDGLALSAVLRFSLTGSRRFAFETLARVLFLAFSVQKNRRGG
jgi:hypothetical protein